MSNVLRIVVQKGTEYQAIEEDIRDEGLFFRDVYRGARIMLEDILEMSDHVVSNASRGKNVRLQDCSVQELNEIIRHRQNNVIAFCANRGYGKTSAMLSFIKGIKNAGNAQNTYDDEVNSENERKLKHYWDGTRASQCLFDILDPIDPTSMEKDDSLLKMVLARMFARFSSHCENGQRQHSTHNSYATDTAWENDKRVLMDHFLRCFYSAAQLHSNEKIVVGDLEDMLEHITQNGDGANLRGMLFKLIEHYLNFIYGATSNAYLIIPIDDADLNTERAYDLLEEVRKYFPLPRVIILLAANFEQLECAVEQHFIRAYEYSLKYSDMFNMERCHSVAELYLQKVIPASRRIYLPDLTEVVQESFENLSVDYIGDQHRELLLDDKAKSCEQAKEWGYQQKLLYFLHRKTGMLFLSPESFLHNFLPASMRELTHFMAHFDALPDVKADYDDIIEAYLYGAEDTGTQRALAQWRSNLDRAQTYLLQSWAATNLRLPGRRLFQNVVKQNGPAKYSYLLKALPNYYSREQKESDIERNSLEESTNLYHQFISACERKGIPMTRIIDAQTDTLATYADMVSALNVLNDLSGGRQYKFVYAIRMYLSIYFHLQLLYGIDHKLSPYHITRLMRDGIFREHAEESTQPPYAHWRLKVPADRLSKSSTDTQHNKPVIAHYFRFKSGKKENALAYPVDEISTEIQSGDHYIFHPFYALMYELDLLTSARMSGNNVVLDTYKRGSLNRSCMQRSLEILLNWDVQYEIQRRLKYSPMEFEKLYLSTGMAGILTKLSEENLLDMVTDPQSDSYPFRAFSDTSLNLYGGMIDAATLAEYLSPALAETNRDHFRATISRLKSLLGRFNEGDNIFALSTSDGETRKEMALEISKSVKNFVDSRDMWPTVFAIFGIKDIPSQFENALHDVAKGFTEDGNLTKPIIEAFLDAYEKLINMIYPSPESKDIGSV